MNMMISRSRTKFLGSVYDNKLLVNPQGTVANDGRPQHNNRAQDKSKLCTRGLQLVSGRQPHELCTHGGVCEHIHLSSTSDKA